jgi:hypothetical protein
MWHQFTDIVDQYGFEVLPPDVRQMGHHLRQLVNSMGYEVTLPNIPNLYDMYPVEKWGTDHQEEVGNNGQLTKAQVQKILQVLSHFGVEGIRLNTELVDSFQTTMVPELYPYRNYRPGDKW